MPGERSLKDRINAATRLTEAEVAGVEWSPQEAMEQRPLRFFVSYAHGDAKLKEDLIERLQVHFSNHKTIQFELWTDGDIIIGEDWRESIERAMEACDFGLLLVSPRFLSSKFIRENELPYLLENKPIIPVAAGKFPSGENADLRGLERKQIFFRQGKSFFEMGQKTREYFAIELYERICARINATPFAPVQRSRTDVSQHFRLSVIDIDLRRFVPPEGVESSLHKGIDSAPAIDAKLRKNAIQFLTEWIEDKQGPPYCALLGETGMGKTTTCKAFAQKLLERRDAGESIPLPIYLDLRHVAGSGKDLVLDEILELILKRSWKGGPRQPRLTAGDVIELVEKQNALVIWDGLDEVLVHLTDREGQLFTRQLFRILPPAGRNGARRGHMLITCRTHYFRTLRDQQTHLRGEDRDNIREQDYRTPFVLLPFTPEQIRQYIQATLPEDDPDRVMEVIGSVHNLSEMAERPYTLQLIVEQFAAIERWKAEGRRVTGVTLYRHLVLSWLERDSGKHQLTPDHKQALMEHFAAALWRSGQRYWTVQDVEQWLIDFLEQNPGMAAHYQGVGREQLKEDLRTATFLVRDGEDQFRFAHTSLQEFFLAGYLWRALVEGKGERWAIERVSRETLDFLGQWMEEQEQGRGPATATLSRIRDQYRAKASEMAFAYCLLAYEKSYPAPAMAGFQLPGADLRRWGFIGTGERPLMLDGLNVSGARLWNTRWRNCRIGNARMQGADLTGAEFLDCRMPGSDWRETVLEATVFRDCDLKGADFEGVQSRKARWLWCELGAAKGLPDAPPAAFMVLNQPGSPARLDLPRSLWIANGHSMIVKSCAWSPDGKRIVSASDDRTLRIWDAETGESLRLLTGHENSVNGCAWSPDGKRIVSASDDRTLRIWDAETGESLRALTGHESFVNECDWSPDGKRIVSASYDNTLRIWDAETGESLRLLTGHELQVNGCAWSPDGKRIASASLERTLRIWDAETGESLRLLTGHELRVNGCAWSPDGKRIASASWDNTLRIWDAETGESLRLLTGHDNRVNGCAWSPDGKRIASASNDKTLRIWDAETGESRRVLTGHESFVNGCAWSPDGKQIASASNDKALRIWDAETGESLRALTGGESFVNGCAWSPDGKRIVSASWNNTLRIWDAETGESLRALTGHKIAVNGCAWSPDGRRIVSASWDNTLRIWDAETGESLRVLTGHDNWVNGCAWSPDGKRIASASWDNTLRIWDSETGENLRALTGHQNFVNGCAWSPDAKRIVSASYDNTLRIWDAESAGCLVVLRGHSGGVRTCEWSRDGRLIVSGGEDGSVRFWDSETGEEIGPRIYLRKTPDGTTWAVVDPANDRILGCDAEAWRILGWRVRGPDGFPMILPAETFGALPVKEAKVRFARL